MNIAGIVAEYNPFHNGHAHQIATLRARGFDAVVCVCSPSVVQRGTAALFPACVRTRAALLGGVDLVLSLPAPYATLSAEGFAQAAVRLLAALGVCDTLAFGAETPDAQVLLQAAHVVQSEPFARALPAQLAGGTSFPTARAAAADAVQPGLGVLLRTPNNILGVEYCKALLTLSKEGAACKMQPLALPREGAQHDAPLPVFSNDRFDGFPAASTVPVDKTSFLFHAQEPPAHAQAAFFFGSATALRALLLQQGVSALAPFVPAAALAVYTQADADGLILHPFAFDTAVLSRLRMLDAAALAHVRGANEGLDHRLAAAVRTAPTLDALYTALKTKRYAHARMRRLVLDAALGYTDSLPPVPPYLQVLGANKTGLAVLHFAKKTAMLPLSQSLARLAAHSPAASAVTQAHAAAEDFAALCLRAPQAQGGAFTQKVIVL